MNLFLTNAYESWSSKSIDLFSLNLDVIVNISNARLILLNSFLSNQGQASVLKVAYFQDFKEGLNFASQ